MTTNLVFEAKEHGGDYEHLSPSSASTLLNCEQLWAHRKLWKTPMDSDYIDDRNHLNLGKAFHQVLEDHKHFDGSSLTIGVNLLPLVKAICLLNNVVEEAAMVTAMVIKYVNFHRACGMPIVRCELPISYKEIFYGIVDAIVLDKNNTWWIRDMKTAANWAPDKLPRLLRDPQLGLYAYFATHMHLGEVLGLGKFLGTRYNVTTKSKAVQQPSDKTEEGFIHRLATKHIKTYEVVIPVEHMATGEIWEEHEELWRRSQEIRRGAAPRKNYRNCIDGYNNKCPFWSKCFSVTNTACKSLISVYDEESVRIENSIGDLI